VIRGNWPLCGHQGQSARAGGIQLRDVDLPHAIDDTTAASTRLQTRWAKSANQNSRAANRDRRIASEAVQLAD
jgi:hypothetical protein